MAWCVKNCKVAVWSREIACRHFYCNSSLLLFFSIVHHVSESKALFVVNLGLAFVGTQHLTRNHAIFEENLTRKRTFSAINVSNNNQVQVMLFLLSRLDRLAV